MQTGATVKEGDEVKDGEQGETTAAWTQLPALLPQQNYPLATS